MYANKNLERFLTQAGSKQVIVFMIQNWALPQNRQTYFHHSKLRFKAEMEEKEDVQQIPPSLILKI